MSAICTKCGERPRKAKGLCHACYLKQWRGRDLVGTIPGLMTPEQAAERRRRIIAQMRAEGYALEAINERFGGRGIRAGEHEEAA
jgi:hypothetical protein